ncbi:MAG: hypothetical protein WDO19_15550 [Bacteroidota bacterium]
MSLLQLTLYIEKYRMSNRRLGGSLMEVNGKQTWSVDGVHQFSICIVNVLSSHLPSLSPVVINLSRVFITILLLPAPQSKKL